MPFRAVRLPHGICNNLIFGKRLDQAPSGEPSARKAKQAKTRLRAAYDMVPSRASIEISLNENPQYPENAHQKVRFGLRAGFAVLSDEGQDSLVERLRMLPHVG
ncbi:MAG: hypothetical protein ACREVB_00210, partial [Burkholderiales bacterium]